MLLEDILMKIGELLEYKITDGHWFDGNEVDAYRIRYGNDSLGFWNY